MYFDNKGGNNRRNNNSDKRNNNRNNNQSQTPRSYLGTNFASHMIGGFGPSITKTVKEEKAKEAETPDNNQDAEAKYLEDCKNLLDEFVQTYKDNKTNPNVLNDLMDDKFIEVCEVMDKYYDKGMESIVSSMNSILVLSTIKAFSITVNNFMSRKDEVIDDFNSVKRYIAGFLSLALETNHNRMMSDTKSIYIDIITDIYEFEVKDLSIRFNLTEDAILDLLIGIPHFGEDMTISQIKSCYDNFLEMLINHGRSAIDYMNAEHQKELFYYLFKDADGIAVKAAGQCLSDPRIVFDDEQDQALYQEYIKMLYEVVNEHDINEIKMVIRFIITTRERMKKVNEGEITAFDVKEALEYENIKTAITDYLANDKNGKAKEFLV